MYVHVRTFIVAHATPILRDRDDVCATYTTQLAAERHTWLCTANVFFTSVFPRRLQSQKINLARAGICLLFVLPASIKVDVEV